MNLELDDCGTHDYLSIKIPRNLTEQQMIDEVAHIDDEKERQIQLDMIKRETSEFDPIKLSRSLIGRWRLDSDNELVLITDDNYLNICGTTVKVRSPIFCKSHGLCKKCYGDTHTICHSKYVGVISAQALGEVATQLTLRTFHTGGIAVMSKDQEDGDQQDIINDLSLVNKLLHGSMKLDYPELLMRLFSIYSNHKTLLLVHFECVITQMMRVGDKRWRLLENRHDVDYEIISIENVPSKESFLLALAFSKPYNYIVQGILGSSQTTDGILERMMTNNI
jgi:hypothetical protein